MKRFGSFRGDGTRSPTAFLNDTHDGGTRPQRSGGTHSALLTERPRGVLALGGRGHDGLVHAFRLRGEVRIHLDRLLRVEGASPLRGAARRVARAQHLLVVWRPGQVVGGVAGRREERFQELGVGAVHRRVGRSRAHGRGDDGVAQVRLAEGPRRQGVVALGRVGSRGVARGRCGRVDRAHRLSAAEHGQARRAVRVGRGRVGVRLRLCYSICQEILAGVADLRLLLGIVDRKSHARLGADAGRKRGHDHSRWVG